MGRSTQSRSCSAELNQGSIDGTYKTVVRDRGGLVESTTWDSRKHLSVKGYGIVESAVKELPDMVGPVRTPYTVSTPDPEALGY